MQPIQQDLIIRALALTGKTMEDMDEITYCSFRESDDEKEFSYPKFFYFLLSPEFIDEYMKRRKSIFGTMQSEYYYCERFGQAFYEYQKGDSAGIENLLAKI